MASINRDPETHLSSQKTTHLTRPETQELEAVESETSTNAEQPEKQMSKPSDTQVAALSMEDSSDEEEDDEPFPATISSSNAQEITFNHEETADAFQALMGEDESSPDEDEPLPIAHSTVKIDRDMSDDDVDEPFPSTIQAISESDNTIPQPPSNPSKSESTTLPLDPSISSTSTIIQSVMEAAQSTPPIPSAQASSEISEKKANVEPIEYTQSELYRNVAQRINCCLERRGAV